MDQDMVKRLRASNEYDLTAARLLDCAAVCVEKGWTQNSNARDEHGVDTDAYGPDAVCWCAQGALHAASHRIGLTVVDEWGCVTYAQPDLASHAEPRARYALQFGFYGKEDESTRRISITGWNDRSEQTQRAVVEAFRRGAAHIRERIECVQKGIREAHIQEIRNG